MGCSAAEAFVQEAVVSKNDKLSILIFGNQELCQPTAMLDIEAVSCFVFFGGDGRLS
jgi:hypothetical protein